MAGASLRAMSLGASALLVGVLGLGLLSLKVSFIPDLPVFNPPPPVDVIRPEPPKPPEPKPEPTPKRPPIETRATPEVAPIEETVLDLAPVSAPTNDIAPAGETLAPAPGAPAAPAVITRPRWIERPNGADFARYFPERALDRGVSGKVVLDCLVGADGSIRCTVASETPARYGFGEAALAISRYFRMAPQLEDGRPSEGGRVQVPLQFRAD